MAVFQLDKPKKQLAVFGIQLRCLSLLLNSRLLFSPLILHVFPEISQETAVNPVDIVSTLQSLQMLKYWKGKHLILKRQVGNYTAKFLKSKQMLCRFVHLRENFISS